MNIAMISEHASPAALLGGVDAGGQNVYVDEIARVLASMGHRVDVFTRREHATSPTVRPWGQRVRIVELAAGPASPIGKDEIWPYMPALRDQLLRFMHTHRVRYDLTHGNFWMSGWVAAELRRRRSIPAVQLFHAFGTTKRQHQSEQDTSPRDRIAVERRVVGSVDRIIATCPDEIQQLERHYGALPDRIAMIPLGVDAELFRPIDRSLARQRIGFGLEPDDRVLVYVGRLVERKDVRNVVRALAHTRLPDEPQPKLLIVGGDSASPDPRQTPEIGELLRVAAESGVSDRVIFAGRRERSELPFFYGASDAMVTTPWYEPFGLTPLEAMACARPVIGSQVGGLTFSIGHESSGLLVPPKDPDALAGAISLLLSDSGMAERMGRGGWKRVHRHFTWHAVAEQTAALYADVLDRPNPIRRPLIETGVEQLWRNLA